MLWLLGIIALIYIVLHSQPKCTHIYGFVLIVEDTFTFGGKGGGDSVHLYLPQPHDPRKPKTQYFQSTCCVIYSSFFFKFPPYFGCVLYTDDSLCNLYSERKKEVTRVIRESTSFSHHIRRDANIKLIPAFPELKKDVLLDSAVDIHICCNTRCRIIEEQNISPQS